MGTIKLPTGATAVSKRGKWSQGSKSLEDVTREVKQERETRERLRLQRLKVARRK